MKLYKKIKNKIKKNIYQKYLKNNTLAIYEDLLNLRISSNNIIDNKTDCEWIVFSKDRAIQLHALISSYYEKVINPAPLNILYTTSNSEHQKSYNELIEIFYEHQVSFISETNFRKQLIDLIEKMEVSKIVFFCDDGVVTETFDMNDFTKFNPLVSVPSLLRGLDLTYCFAHQREQELPEFINDIIPDNDKKVWIWKNCPNSPDWAYPLAVGGHLFSRVEMLLLLKLIDFEGPNTLEGRLQYFINIFNIRYGICYNKTQLGSIPANIVNTEVTTNATLEDLSTDELLEKWKQGYRIKYENYYGKTEKEIYNSKFEFVKSD
ncbi:MAG: hypothetical protein KAW92_08965 [Candidatus Cloacimonetes bacterium]|nr:hypothetical protein [Candidatus Cloacimonadota bacterium]